MPVQALSAMGQTMAAGGVTGDGESHMNDKAGAGKVINRGQAAGKNGSGPAGAAGQADTSGSHGVRKGGIKKSDWSAGGGYRTKKSDNPEVLYGRDFEDDFIEIDKIEGEVGQVTIRGKILDKESRLLRSGKTIIIFHLTDFTDTITVKMFADEDSLEDMDKAVAAGSFIRLQGMATIDRFDGELSIGSVRGLKIRGFHY